MFTEDIRPLLSKIPDNKQLVYMFVNVFVAQTPPDTKYLRDCQEWEIIFRENVWMYVIVMLNYIEFMHPNNFYV